MGLSRCDDLVETEPDDRPLCYRERASVGVGNLARDLEESIVGLQFSHSRTCFIGVCTQDQQYLPALAEACNTVRTVS